MSSQLAIFFFCLAIALAYDYPTCPPTEWEGDIAGYSIVEGIPLTAAKFYGKTFYSYSKQMEVSITTTQIGKATYKQKTYRDWRHGLEFVYDLNKRTCKVSKELPGGLKRQCSNSKGVAVLKAFMIGNQAAQTIQTSEVDIKSAITTVLKSSLLPVSGVYNTEYEGAEVYTTIQFGNVKTGCSNPAVFSLPKSCLGYVQKYPIIQGKKDIIG